MGIRIGKYLMRDVGSGAVSEPFLVPLPPPFLWSQTREVPRMSGCQGNSDLWCWPWLRAWPCVTVDTVSRSSTRWSLWPSLRSQKKKLEPREVNDLRPVMRALTLEPACLGLLTGRGLSPCLHFLICDHAPNSLDRDEHKCVSMREAHGVVPGAWLVPCNC